MSALEDSKPVLMLPAALWWASKGVPVFPLHNAVLTAALTWACSCGDPCRKDSPAKHPRTEHGVHDASTDPKVIAAWWERWPEANIGLACGVTFDLLDIDGPAGFEVLKQIEAELGPLSPLCVVESGRADGGRHYYLSPPTLGGLSGKRTAPPGIDVKSVGGYAVAPPSQHVTGYRYTMTQPYAPLAPTVTSNWEAVHARLRELAPQKPHVEVSKQPPVPAEHRSDTWRRRARSWCSKALEGVAGKLADMPENSGRNDYLNAQTWRMLRFAHAGHLDAGEVLDAMRQAALDSRLSHTETETTLRSAINGADREGPLDPNIGEDTDYDPFARADDAPPEPEPDAAPVAIATGEVVEPAGAPEPDTSGHAPSVDDEAFWTARPELEHIRLFARARMCSPWAVFGVVAVRVVTATPHWVVLPATIGSHASLNLFTALVGPSGGGKGAAESAAADAIHITSTEGAEIETATVGSGEGIGHLYAHRERGTVVRDKYAVLFTVPEVDNLVALTGRQGSTLLPQLRSAWSGERLGFAYADPKKALPIARHDYRMGLVLGIQPGRAAPILDDADGGTPQRFLWMPVNDPDAPEVPPDTPEPLELALGGVWEARGGQQDPFSSAAGLVVLPIPDVARDTIIVNRRSRLRGEGEALDGHALQARLKIAAALALLAGRRAMSEEDWDLAGVVMEVSDATRRGVVEYLSTKATQSNRAKGEAEGMRAVVVADRVAEESLKRVARRILGRLRGTGEALRSDLRRGVAARDRAHFDEALERLLDAGTVEVEKADRGEMIKLRP